MKNELIELIEQNHYNIEHTLYSHNDEYMLRLFTNYESLPSPILYYSDDKTIYFHDDAYILFTTMNNNQQSEFLRYLEKKFDVIINSTNCDGE